MSGYFRRLLPSAHAGTPALRPQATLPYAPLTLVDPASIDPDARGGPTLRSALSDGAANAAAIPSSPSSPRADRPAPSSAARHTPPAPHAGAWDAAPDTSLAASSAASRDRIHAPLPTRVRGTRAREHAEPESASAPADGTTPRDFPSGAPSAGAEGATPRLAHRSGAASADDFRLMDDARTRASSGAEDAASTCAPADARRAASHEIWPARTLAPSIPRRGDTEPTEVHVTIGRIEVRAIHAPPPPARQSAPRRAPLSLDDYLAQRQRGGA